MSARLFVVMSGLPASGKTTLAKALVNYLGLPLIDKDDILESLFDSLGVDDLAARQKLSRASDVVLARLVERSAGAIIVSFWRHETSGGTAGTPFHWLRQLPGLIVEVHCDCPADTAEERFRSRPRHPGHQDSARSPEALRRQFRELAALGPLNAGPVLTVETWKPYDLPAIAQAIRHVATQCIATP